MCWHCTQFCTTSQHCDTCQNCDDYYYYKWWWRNTAYRSGTQRWINKKTVEVMFGTIWRRFIVDSHLILSEYSVRLDAVLRRRNRHQAHLPQEHNTISKNRYLVQWRVDQKPSVLLRAGFARRVAMYRGLVSMIDRVRCRKFLIKLVTSGIRPQQTQLHMNRQTYRCTITNLYCRSITNLYHH